MSTHSFVEMEESLENPKIFVLGDSILKEVCNTVNLNDILDRKEDLFHASSVAHKALSNFRAANGFGRAIAAPQVGFNIRMIAVNLDNKKETMFNPEITYRSEEMFSMWDDCLSFPNLMACVRRHKHISIKFINEEGIEQHWENCSQAISELLQHEVDHLNGVLAVDIAQPIVSKDGEVLCEAVVDRNVWLKEKEKFDAMVDYTI